MKFGEVIDALEKGLPIRRALWEEDIYTCYNADNYMFIDVFIDGQTIENQYPALKMVDLAADDWEIHEWDESEEDEVRPCPEFAKEIIEDYQLAEMTGEIIKSTNADFEYELRKLISIHGLAKTVPDYILAEYLNNCLDAFDKATNKRDYYRRKLNED